MGGDSNTSEFDHQFEIGDFIEPNLEPIGAAARAELDAIVRPQGVSPAPDLGSSEAQVNHILGVEVQDLLAADPVARPGRPRSADDEAIAGAVLQALVERGYDGMTVDHVARLAGVGRATLYRRWPTKTAMVIDALGRGRFPTPEDPDTGDPRADFLSLLRVVQETFQREHHVMRALQLEVARHPDIGVALSRDFIAPRLDVVIGVLRRAATAGLLRAPSDLELLARLGPALIWQHFSLLTNEPDPDLPRRITDLVFADRSKPTRSRR